MRFLFCLPHQQERLHCTTDAIGTLEARSLELHTTCLTGARREAEDRVAGEADGTTGREVGIDHGGGEVGRGSVGGRAGRLRGAISGGSDSIWDGS